MSQSPNQSSTEALTPSIDKLHSVPHATSSLLEVPNGESKRSPSDKVVSSQNLLANPQTLETNHVSMIYIHFSGIC